ncbi:hypothetical protein [Microvirga mediterraneensis]|uniref:Uncharacterized protein n=1 Tax=Microvirga mediterraneensis TaxID=2754695 RepID=A0A838BQB6_9HYPH|nr:hypothetical protein [Microvirga mediterraneensis]MBA1157934.1 hypothetical protein [Microvirga mediterraneensis]
MGMMMLIDGVVPLGKDVWSGSAPPHILTMLGQAKVTAGTRSVLLVEALRFDEADKSLRFDASQATVLNLGTTDDIIVLSNSPAAKLAAVRSQSATGTYGPGDQEFLSLVRSELMGEAKEAAEQILRAVRSRYPGDLEKGLRLNFKNTPDNFWYVIVQPRVQSLSITVRGVPQRFLPSSLDLKLDRPGYTRFAVRTPDEVAEALRIIEGSRRKS